jgi:hypothetical protein
VLRQLANSGWVLRAPRYTLAAMRLGGRPSYEYRIVEAVVGQIRAAMTEPSLPARPLGGGASALLRERLIPRPDHKTELAGLRGHLAEGAAQAARSEFVENYSLSKLIDADAGG